MTNLDTPPDFQSLTREVVDSFLQTAVVLDDLAAMSPSTQSLPIDGPSRLLREPDFPVPSTPDSSIATIDPQDVSLDAEAVIAGFADIGSVCAVLSPGSGDDFKERTVKAARRSDIVILDWKIHDSFGDTALDVLREILKDDRHNGRLRLIAIYTAQPDLGEIFGRIKDEISRHYEEEPLVETPNVRLSKGPLHVVILAKQGTINDQRPELKSQEVTERELAERLANEFALMTGGLIRNAAIAGIASIRDNSHRILAKFEGSLDPAYLGHRLLLHHPPDAEDHIVEALGSEVLSVLEEDRPGTRADIDAIRSWLAMQEDNGLELSCPFPFQDVQNPVEGWRDLLVQGFEAPCTPTPTMASKSNLRKRSTEPFSENAAAAMSSNRRFSALLSLKTRYPGHPPRLSMGTLLCMREGDEEQYFLCLQPKCDSVRLNDWSGFPLIPLIPLEDVNVGNEGTSLRLVVELGKDLWKDFGIEPKPSELSVPSFKPGPNPPGEVVATQGHDGEFYFKDSEGRRFCWMAEMKDEHALDVAVEVASALARPGPNDGEWLRRAFGTSL